MSELLYMEKWDLQAVVGAGNSNDMENPNCFSSSFDVNPAAAAAAAAAWGSFQVEEEYVMSSCPDIYEANPNISVLDELEELYKPFFYPDDHHCHFSTQTIVTSSLPQHMMDEAAVNQKRQQQAQSVSDQPAAATIMKECCSTQAVVPIKPRRSSRKNQQNRVVQHVTADGVSSDKWAWRKYGQKPIKGSPYPRSYYRCSSSKGCLARKQVERSCTDPGTFIITYTAEHSHGQPTRRNSLAGSTRTKSSNSTPKTSTTLAKHNNNNNNNIIKAAAADLSAGSLLSPTTTSTTIKHDDHLQIISVKMEEQIMFEELDEGELLGDKMLLSSPADIRLSSDGELVESLDYNNFEEGLLFLDQSPDLSYDELWSTSTMT